MKKFIIKSGKSELRVAGSWYCFQDHEIHDKLSYLGKTKKRDSLTKV